jgi:hypothetical protein
MPYICNDCTTVSTGLQSIPIFASFPRTKPVLHPAISSVIHLLQGVKLPHFPDNCTVESKIREVFSVRACYAEVTDNESQPLSENFP